MELPFAPWHYLPQLILLVNSLSRSRSCFQHPQFSKHDPSPESPRFVWKAKFYSSSPVRQSFVRRCFVLVKATVVLSSAGPPFVRGKHWKMWLHIFAVKFTEFNFSNQLNVPLGTGWYMAFIGERIVCGKTSCSVCAVLNT